ncbi:MAG TPA: pyridoxal 5'-phosphate synthase glutaminase subunit PdxT [Candidatus Dormibacteraeota bacterium]|nr:pyridoxal 5'-phosphate synthase glutaminase subunit PdxT [Candidatus Dormibacteraeota bacterium]
MKVGILSVQGDFAAHAEMLHSLGAETIEVRTSADLSSCDALILPGGESTTQLQFLKEEGLFESIRRFAAEEHPVFGTCAGAILLATEVKNPNQDSLRLLDMTVLRNAYGRQLASDVVYGTNKFPAHENSLEMVFIRAPIIERVGSDVEVLAQYDGKPTLVRKGNILASTFHPELTSDSAVHQYFLDLVNVRDKEASSVSAR